MAYWVRAKTGRVKVCWYDRLIKKIKVLPRTESQHLDNLLDAEIADWVKQWEASKVPPVEANLSPRLTEFEAFLRSRRRRPGTIKEHLRLLQKYILPFFPENPNDWPSTSVRLLTHLDKKGLSPEYIWRCNVALRVYYRWLQEEGYAKRDLVLMLRNPIREYKTTPLKRLLTPDEVVDWAEKFEGPQEVKLMGLIGYFCSLRPQELFALKPMSFKAGSVTTDLECAKAMRSVNLFSRLVVSVKQQKDPFNQLTECKANSGGLVACFDERAARMILELISVKNVSQPLFTGNVRGLYQVWKEHGLKDCTLKDLRRASLYWLGHHTQIKDIQLMKHARHRKLETTMRYMRKPEEALEHLVALDLDA